MATLFGPNMWLFSRGDPLNITIQAIMIPEKNLKKIKSFEPSNLTTPIFLGLKEK